MRLLSQLRLGRSLSLSRSLSQFRSRMLVTLRLRGGGDWKGEGPSAVADDCARLTKMPLEGRLASWGEAG